MGLDQVLDQFAQPHRAHIPQPVIDNDFIRKPDPVSGGDRNVEVETSSPILDVVEKFVGIAKFICETFESLSSAYLDLKQQIITGINKHRTVPVGVVGDDYVE